MHPAFAARSIAVLLAVVLVCPIPSAIATDLTALKQSVIADYATLVRASYQDAFDAARILTASVDAFVDKPGQATLARARQAWIDARIPYAQTESYRFYDG